MIVEILFITILFIGLYILGLYLKHKRVRKELTVKKEELLSKVNQLAVFKRMLTAMTYQSHTLADLLELHKIVWKADLKVPNIGPLSSMFRTKDIATMTLNEVYLGNVYGLWTNTAEFFSKCEETMAGNGWGIDEDLLIKDVIFNQYKNHLLRNIASTIDKNAREVQLITAKLCS